MKRKDIERRPMYDATLEALEPEDKEYLEPDGNNLYFRVKPNGSKSWKLRYKKLDGTWSWLGLGSYPEVKGKAARLKAIKIQAEIATGANSPLTRQEKKQAATEEAHSTFDALFHEWYNGKITKSVSAWTEGTAKRNKAAFENHILPVMGKRQFKDITPQEWYILFQSIQQKTNKQGNPIIEQSKRIRQNCHEIYDLAKVTGRICKISSTLHTHSQRH